MKKISKILIALLLVMVSLFGITGCNTETQKQLQSKIDELQTQIEDLQSRIEDLQSQNKESQSQIEDLEQELERRSNLLRENAKSGLYSLQLAYEMGLLTREDLMSIAYYHNGGRRYNDEIMTEDYIPQPKMPEVLSEETQLKIKSAVAEEYRENYDIKDAEADGFTITQYCGTYGNCIAVMTRDIYSGSADVEWIDSIAGVNIYYNNGISIQVWMGTK